MRSRSPWRSSGGVFDYDRAVVRLDELNARAEDPALWNDPKQAQAVMRERTKLEGAIATIKRLRAAIDDNVGLIEMAESEKDEAMIADAERALAEARAEAAKARLETLLSGEADANNAYVEINAGAGGTESQDWAEMLLRMYLRWAEREGLDVELDEVLPGEEAGIKSATFIVHGPHAYGLISAERGVHRLVRISPFDAQKRRHTSFASLDVIPLLEETDEEDIEIDPKELRVDVYRSTGPGGQSVNTTDSAVRITHLPTGIMAVTQNERSQLQNRAVAMRILKARLADRMRREQQEKLEDLRGERRGIDFGSQIRSYVLAPYRLVKDHRTGIEIGDVDRVLDGDIEGLIEAELRRRASEAQRV
jgi:peptide chain release factor 2